MMRHFLERLLGKATVVGFLSMFGHPRPIETKVEIDPHTGRETLLSMITSSSVISRTSSASD